MGLCTVFVMYTAASEQCLLPSWSMSTEGQEVNVTAFVSSS